MNDDVSKSGTYSISDQEEYNLSIKHIQQFNQEKQSLLNMSLAYDYYAPALKVYRDLAVDTIEKSSMNETAFGHSSWAFYKGKILTSYNDIALIDEVSDSSYYETDIFDIDRVYPGKDVPTSNTVILYSSPFSPEFNRIHKHLKSLSIDGHIKYVLRPWHTISNRDELIELQGYGVELALKNVEYKVRDQKEGQDSAKDAKDESVHDDSDDEVIGGFLFSRLFKAYPQHEKGLRALMANIINTESGYENMKPWEIEKLGLKASYHIMSSTDPLKALRDVSHNLPFMASLISRESMKNETLVQKLEKLSSPNPEKNIMLINGKIIDTTRIDPFQLYDRLYEEIFMYNSLISLGLKGSSASNVLTTPKPGHNQPHIDVLSDSVLFLNDLERDQRYRQWPTSLKSIIETSHPVPPVRKNVVTMIAVVDLATPKGAEIVETTMQFFYKNMPVRIGYLFVSGTDDNSINTQGLAAMCFKQVTQIKQVSMFYFLREMGKAKSVDDVVAVCEHFTGETVNKILLKHSEWVKSMKEHLVSKNLNLPGINSVFINGKLQQDTNIYALFTAIGDQYAIAKERVKVDLSSMKDLYQYFLNQNKVYDKYESTIFNSDTEYLPLVQSKYKSALSSIPYINGNQNSDLYKSTHWLFTDLESKAGKDITLSLIHFLRQNDNKAVRFAVMNQEIIELNQWNNLETKVLVRSIQTMIHLSDKGNVKYDDLLSTLKALIEVNNLSFTEAQDIAKQYSDFKSVYTSDILLHSMNNQSLIYSNIHSKEFTTIISNGKILRLSESGSSSWNSDLFKMLVAFELDSQELLFNSLLELAFEHSHTPREISDIHLVLSSLILSQKDSIDTDMFDDDAFHYINGSPIHIKVSLDPLSPDAQRLSALLLSVRNSFKVDLSLLLTPQTAINTFPLKNFYRYAIQDLQFDEQGKKKVKSLVFNTLPQTKLLSMNIHPPEPWMVEPIECDHDLDNILLDDTNGDVHAIFELEHILIEGSCQDLSASQPPRGLQLALQNHLGGKSVDTLVMSNLGYFQLKANPGIWNLKLAEGKADEIYKMVSHHHKVIISSFSGISIPLKVERKEGKENEELLDVDIKGGAWNSFKSLFAKKGKEKEEKIHIFSVASGHLYERFLRLMMLSVVRNTKSEVKFWIIKNFLSPTFKNSIQSMADHFGFEVEFVQYKWPSWLNHQTEKQRIIWGYKILFLDVLFPLNLKRVIYIDTDQIVRSDVKELFDMDLEGAPYGFTPFCRGDIKRKETEQFRFWESGFWKDHLGDRPYHISALFVIDLQLFRAIGAGDILRSTYMQLSQDPNSLANLDQDLPNFLQHRLPIFSLPKEWLWCETWCTDNSKTAAKTIDLCNNPLTKAPKLDSAVRIIDEWTSLDTEIKNVIENQPIKHNQENENVKDEL